MNDEQRQKALDNEKKWITMQETVKKFAKRQGNLYQQHPWFVRCTVVTIVGAFLYMDWKRNDETLPYKDPFNHLFYRMRLGKDARPTGASEEEMRKAGVLIEGKEEKLIVGDVNAEKPDGTPLYKQPPPGMRDGNVPFKMSVYAGHLERRENVWDLRGNERNWSIMAQDHQRQLDSFDYRKERSKDDDYARQSFPK